MGQKDSVSFAGKLDNSVIFCRTDEIQRIVRNECQKIIRNKQGNKIAKVAIEMFGCKNIL